MRKMGDPVGDGFGDERVNFILIRISLSGTGQGNDSRMFSGFPSGPTGNRAPGSFMSPGTRTGEA